MAVAVTWALTRCRCSGESQPGGLQPAVNAQCAGCIRGGAEVDVESRSDYERSGGRVLAGGRWTKRVIRCACC